MRIFDESGIRLVNGDCLTELPKVAARSIDMVLCDLPYGTTHNKWDSVLPLPALWAEYERIIKENGVVLLFAQTPFDKILGASNIRLLKYEWIWQKQQGTGHLNAKKMPLKIHENILVFYRNLPPDFPQMTAGEPYRCVSGKGSSNYDKQKPTLSINPGYRYPVSVIKAKSDKGLHPTQKPIELCECFIKTYTAENAVVLDNCMGSGTVGAACVRLGRRFIGMEKDESYYLKAENRIKNELLIRSK